MVSVFHKRNRWWALIYDKGTRRQKWHPLKEELTCKRDAKLEAGQLVERLKKESATSPPVTKPGGWKESAFTLIAERERRGDSDDWIKILERFIDRFEDFVGDCLAADLTENDAHRYYATRAEAKNAGASHLRKEFLFLRAVLRRAGNPIFNAVPLPAEPKADPKFLKPEEFDKLIKAASPEHAFRWTLLAYSGARTGEACKLTWADVDLKHKTLRIQNAAKGKGAKLVYRRVPIPAPLLTILKARNEERKPEPDDPLLDRVKLDKRPNNWRRDLMNDCKRAGVKLATPHVLRHSYCTWLAQQGLSIFDIAGLAGHESVETTQKYAHHSPQVNRAAAEALEKLAKTTEKTTEKRNREKEKRRAEAA